MRLVYIIFEYNKVTVKLSDSQLNKLKSAVKHQTGITFENEY